MVIIWISWKQVAKTARYRRSRSGRLGDKHQRLQCKSLLPPSLPAKPYGFPKPLHNREIDALTEKHQNVQSKRSAKDLQRE